MPQVTYATHDLAMGEWKNLFFGVWRAKPTVESAEMMRARYLALADRYPSGFFSFGLIEADVPNPDERARKAISAAMDAAEDRLLGATVVLEATGFGGAALRAALATMSMLTRSRFPRRFFGSVEDAAVWAARIMPDLGGASAIQATFARFRGQI